MTNRYLPLNFTTFAAAIIATEYSDAIAHRDDFRTSLDLFADANDPYLMLADMLLDDMRDDLTINFEYLYDAESMTDADIDALDITLNEYLDSDLMRQLIATAYRNAAAFIASTTA